MTQSISPAKLALLARSRGTEASLVVAGTLTTYWRYPAAVKSSNTQKLIFIHGYRGNHRGLEAIAGALPNFEILIPDLPGYGKSGELGNGHTIENYTEWLSEFVTNTAPEATVLGHSFGSIVVACAAARNGLTNRLVLVNPVCRFKDERHKQGLQSLVDAFYAFTGSLPEWLAKAILSSPVFVQAMSSKLAKTWNPRLRAWIHREHLTNFSDFTSVKSVLEGYQASIKSSVSDYSADVGNETLLIAADRDDITTFEAEVRNARQMRNATLARLDGVGHLIHYERPTEAAKLIETFLAK